MGTKKWKEALQSKELLNKFLALVLTAAAALLFLNVLTDDRDGRQQVVDEDGAEEITDFGLSGEEQRLQRILSTMEGVGEVSVLLSREPESGRVQGAVIAAEGAEHPVIKSRILDAVAALYAIGVNEIAVFPMDAAKESGGRS